MSVNLFASPEAEEMITLFPMGTKSSGIGIFAEIAAADVSFARVGRRFSVLVALTVPFLDIQVLDV